MDSKGDYQGFDNGFEGFPKRLPDDCVEYSLFVIDAKLKPQKEILSRLEYIRKEGNKLAESLLKEYIWQREGFQLSVKTDKGMTFLHGLTNYGDSVEDEWLIVYILKELSNRFQDLWIKVTDTDGEFLLIEAANALPRWLNPEIADNRVWLHSNSLRLIPPSDSLTPALSSSLDLEEACRIIATNPSTLIHSPLIEAEAFYRLRNYPSQIQASLHHAVVTIPRKLAYILHVRPAYIAPAVEAFYLRDPIAMKSLGASSSNHKFPAEDLVTVSVRLTKVLYAQVNSQQFSPPPVWKDQLAKAKSLPVSAGAKPHTRLETGMKITSGVEMLVTDPKNEDNRSVREIRILLDDLAAGDELLPTDDEISTWENVLREDDEKWMDINFEDFERELDGKRKAQTADKPGTFGPLPPSGFGDANTQADLKKMVERFETFLNNDEADMDGVDVDDMDIDNDDDDSDEDSDDEDKAMSFDEAEFSRMMREMMGLPADEETINPKSTETDPGKLSNDRRLEELDSDDGDEEEEIQKLMKGMEAELNEAGALNLNPAPKMSGSGTSLRRATDDGEQEDNESSDDEDVNIDFNLAKNLLESFKSQAGMPGPGGNLLGLMGLQLPRDEDDEQQPTVKKS